MQGILLSLHLLCIGLWLGCVLTEALFERALLGKGREAERLLSKLHKRVDLLVEIPVFVLVFVTGALLIPAAADKQLFHVKLGFALLAILANVYCVYLVFKREHLAQQGDWQAFEKVDRLQHKIGALVLVGILGALVLGLYLFTR